MRITATISIQEMTSQANFFFWIATVSIALFCMTARATSDFQTWTQVVPKYQLNSTLTVSGAFQMRLGRGAVDQVLTDINLTHKKGNLAVEGGFITLSRVSPFFSRLEWRPWAGISHNLKTPKLQWANRLRSEVRFFSGASSPNIRIRFLTGLTLAAIDSAKKIQPFVDDEVFFHLNSVTGGANSGFDQNRFRIGLKTSLSSEFKLSASYMNMWVKRRASNLMLHVPFLSLSWDLS